MRAAFPRTAVMACLGGLLAACGSVPAPVLPNELPPAWRAAGAARPGAATPDLQNWWKVLGDPVLDQLVDRVGAQSLTLAQAGSRLKAARRFAAAEGARFRPALDASVQTVQDAAAIDNYLRGGIQASWELGLYGVRQAVDQGARARLEEAVVGEQASRVSVIAEVVRQYLELRAAQRDGRFQQAMTDIDDKVLALHQVRDRLRLQTQSQRQAVELRRLRGTVAGAVTRQSAAAAAQAIAALLGQTEVDTGWSEAAPGSTVPTAPVALQLAQVPADLLRYRPDVRLAAVDVDRATSELGLARAELYPRVTLGLSYLYAYNLTQNRRNLNSDLPAIGLAIDIPLFDWGRRQAAASAQEEALQASLFGYRQTLVQAVDETEAALSGFAHAREQADLLTQAERLGRRQVALEATRERLGLASTLDRLEAERGLVQLQLDAATASSACSQALVTVYRALGGAPLDKPGGDEVGSDAALPTVADRSAR